MATSEEPHDVCTIEATVPTGFESVASDEAKEIFKTDCRSARGKITFQTPTERVKDILNLGGIDHCRARVFHKEYFGFTADGDDCLTRLQLLVKECNWTKGLDIWSKFYSFAHPISPVPEHIPTDEELIDICYSVHMPGHSKKEKGKSKSQKRKDRYKEKISGKKQQEAGKTGDAKGVDGEKADGGDGVGVEAAPSLTKENQDGDGGDAQKGQGGEQKVSEPVASDQNEADVTESDPKSEIADSKNDDTSLDQVAQVSTEIVDKDPVNVGGDSVEKAPALLSAEEENMSANGDSVLTPSSSPEKGTAKESCGDPEAPAAGKESPEDAKKKAKRETRDPSKPAFRITCKRTGEGHSFDSMSAAATLGSAVQKWFGWDVDMTHYDIEVVLTIDNNEVSVGMALTPESLHKRNLVAFGVTTLRPTICHNMLRMVKVMPGHIVCDPLCGTGSIPIQGALRFPALQLCGDNHPVALEKTFANLDALNKKKATKGSGGLMMDVLSWNACNIPLRDGIVDVFVSDLPFGKSYGYDRVGRRSNNRQLYIDVLDEMARCGKLSGRAALLTGDINNMMKAIQAQKYWARRRVYSCNIGGIGAAVFLLFRNAIPYVARTRSSDSHSSASNPGSSSSNSQAPPPARDGADPSDKPDASDPNQNGAANPPPGQGGSDEPSMSLDELFGCLVDDYDQSSEGEEGSTLPAEAEGLSEKEFCAGDDEVGIADEGESLPMTLGDGKQSMLTNDVDTALLTAHTSAPGNLQHLQENATACLDHHTTTSNLPHSYAVPDGDSAIISHTTASSNHPQGFSALSGDQTAVNQAAEGGGRMHSSAEKAVSADPKFRDTVNHHHHHHYHHHHNHVYHHHYHECSSGPSVPDQGADYSNRENQPPHRDGQHQNGDAYQGNRVSGGYRGNRDSNKPYGNKGGYYGNKGNQGNQYGRRGNTYGNTNRDGYQGSRDGQGYGSGVGRQWGAGGHRKRGWEGEEKKQEFPLGGNRQYQPRAENESASVKPRAE